MPFNSFVGKQQHWRQGETALFWYDQPGANELCRARINKTDFSDGKNAFYQIEIDWGDGFQPEEKESWAQQHNMIDRCKKFRGFL